MFLLVLTVACHAQQPRTTDSIVTGVAGLFLDDALFVRVDTGEVLELAEWRYLTPTCLIVDATITGERVGDRMLMIHEFRRETPLWLDQQTCRFNNERRYRGIVSLGMEQSAFHQLNMPSAWIDLDQSMHRYRTATRHNRSGLYCAEFTGFQTMSPGRFGHLGRYSAQVFVLELSRFSPMPDVSRPADVPEVQGSAGRRNYRFQIGPEHFDACFGQGG
ncbi:MAG: hypothetical protein AB7J28_06590 [Hyphomonadaceae bacterium]